MTSREEVEVVIEANGVISVKVLGKPSPACQEVQKAMVDVGTVLQQELPGHHHHHDHEHEHDHESHRKHATVKKRVP